jgi:hypothetical protein
MRNPSHPLHPELRASVRLAPRISFNRFLLFLIRRISFLITISRDFIARQTAALKKALAG